MLISRRHFLQVTAASTVVVPSVARAQTFPARPISVIVPSAPAGTTDITARFVSEYMSQLLGQQFVVENVGGASGNIGNIRAARATPDGYTLLMSYSGYHVANPHLFKKWGGTPSTVSTLSDSR